MKYIFTMLIILLCSCSAKKELIKSENITKENKTELAENVGVMEYNFNEVDTSNVCLSIIQEAVKFDTLGRVSEIKRTTAVKTKNNRISKAETNTAVQTSQTTSISVKQDSTTYFEEKVVEPFTKTYHFDWLWLLIVIIVCVAVKRKIDKL